ncbi:MAG TPA: sodium:solute symporter family protein, partial [Desulfatiglandales bacterium]|nr:sodium:solute symporter family protein [Desulfatiglandales bacterium]
AWLGIIAGQIVAAGKILETIIDAPSTLLMAITAFVFILYTILGGQYSVVRTDTIQSFIIIVAILVSVPLCLGKIGGVVAMKQILGYEYFSFPINQYFTWKSLVVYIFLIGSTYLVGPDIYSRLFCARDEETAKRATMTVALILIPFAFAITIIGMSARVLFPQINPEASFPYMISHILPTGLSGLVIASLLAAMMSSADTCLLTTSTILSMDVVKPIFKPNLKEDRLLLLSRFLIAFIGILSLFLALKLKGVISSLILGYTVYTSGLIFPILLGFYRHRLKLNKTGAISAMIIGGGLALIGKLMGWNFFGFPAGLYGFFLSGITLVIASRFSHPKLA